MRRDLKIRHSRSPQGYQLRDIDLILRPSLGNLNSHRRRAQFICTVTAPTISRFYNYRRSFQSHSALTRTEARVANGMLTMP